MVPASSMRQMWAAFINGRWIQSVSRWVTSVYAKTTVSLPKTGY